MTLEQDLKEEIKKWTKKLDASLKDVKAVNQRGIEFLTNIKAYQSDSLHFYQKKDLIRSYEALIWAWAYLEIAMQTEILAKNE